MSYIKIWDYGTKERKSLELVAGLLNKFSKYNIKYAVRDIYFDYGQDWWWTTLIVNCEDKWGGYQIYPAEQKRIIDCDSPAELAEILNYYLVREKEEEVK